ncbi:MAG: hypothetical protein PHV02_07485 [Rhodocyclaceae bacterium]|nr:hypothetical protein [Rhodocyclaceae bacterium]
MTTTADYLAKFNVSMQQALDFIAANINSPGTIFDVAKGAGLTNEMLADIVAQAIPGFSANDMKSWFGSQGFDANALDQVVSDVFGAMVNTSMSNLNTDLQNLGMLEFSNNIMASWRDAGADFDMDGVVERAAESLNGQSLSQSGLNYLLNVGIRLTDVDAKSLENAMTLDIAALMNSTNPADVIWSGMMNVFNGALSRPAPTDVTQEMLDSVASGYVTMIGQFKPAFDQLSAAGIDMF